MCVCVCVCVYGGERECMCVHERDRESVYGIQMVHSGGPK